jgi:16S rRNA (guanine(527)-N(7))-methyltransferase RsmG
VRREPPLGAAGFAAIFPVSRETAARLEAYIGLLERWSVRINLVGRDTLADPWRRHILDSAQLQPLVPDTARSLIDLGSGAGFPGLVLAILGTPRLEVVELVEADSRKCAFLREAARITGTRAAIRQARIEALPRRPFDIVTARALAPLDRLLGLARPFLATDGMCLFLKGAQAAEELTLAGKAWTMTATSIESRSDPRGVVLQLQQVDRAPRAGGG